MKRKIGLFLVAALMSVSLMSCGSGGTQSSNLISGVFLTPTPMPTSTSTPTPKPTPKPTSRPTSTPTPTSKSTPKPTSTPKANNQNTGKASTSYNKEKGILSPDSFSGYKLKISRDEINHKWNKSSDMYDGEHRFFELTGTYGEEDWVDEYIKALTKNFDFKLVDSWKDDYSNVGEKIYYSYLFEYTGKEKLTHFFLSAEDFDGKHKYKKSPCDLYLWVGADPFDGDYFVTLEYSTDLHLVETSDRTTKKLTNTSSGTSSSGSSSGGSSSSGSDGIICASCGGTGKCSTCGGSGYVYRYTAGGKYEKFTCSACFGGKCKPCGGDGRVGDH